MKEEKYAELEKMVKDYEAYVKSPEFHEDNDWPHYIYEAAVTAVLGKDFWKVVNGKMNQ